ncbi:MAG: 4-(cytidine 5'-diphospho)-2-C-methyl-D-erythritol kinase [Candidatus Saganbacteria bacterium]|nr:4-(cytidine 5'-diphospho)-2-C-methyl-D-erythritol kinase [Candidatus Saganbacteria bacterium]
MPSNVSIRSFAKLNLTLHILGPRGDGYHEIDSIMQSVSLHDILSITEIPQGIKISCNDPAVPQGRGNIVYKAAETFFSLVEISKGVEILLDKRIPVAAGLAGGSGNAAATLFGLNLLFDAKISKVKLEFAAAGLGGDVPFCLTGGRARVRGKGDVVQPLSPMLDTWVVLVKPAFGVPVKLAYDEFDKLWAKREREKRSLPSPAAPAPSEVLFNDLEEGIFRKFPELPRIKERLIKLGAVGAAMSGSGSTVFGIAKDKADAERLVSEMKRSYKEVYLAETVDRGVEVIS